MLPDSLTEIGNGAFTCSGAMRLTIPEHVSEMGSGIFSSYDALEYVEFLNCPDQVPECMFIGCAALSNVAGLDSVRRDRQGGIRGMLIAGR